MILVTGAAGKTGRAVVTALAGKGEKVKALVRRPEQVEQLKALGAVEVMVGDMLSQVTFEHSMPGCRAVYHICPNVDPYETVIGAFAIQEAHAAGVEHFVYHSVLHPQTEDMPHHWKKLHVEEYLFESGLNYTILQPTVYMQNFLASWDKIIREHIYPVAYPPETRLGMVDLQDVAEAAVQVLTEGGHWGATYELVGCEPLSITGAVDCLSQVLGFTVNVVRIDLDSWSIQAQKAGMGEYQVDTLSKMFQYYEKHGLWGNPNVLSWLLKRPPTSFLDFAARIAGERINK
jgi:NAD(P)H dehydrogenase (quinone)